MISYPLIHFPPINLWSVPSLQKTGEKLLHLPLAQPVGWGGNIPDVSHSLPTDELTGYAQRYPHGYPQCY
jgi:hypothetical protein